MRRRWITTSGRYGKPGRGSAVGTRRMLELALLPAERRHAPLDFAVLRFGDVQEDGERLEEGHTLRPPRRGDSVAVEWRWVSHRAQARGRERGWMEARGCDAGH